uniref:Uncharacterized protein n=1 Tax=Ditylenchus dipsaci TaxID=166011 RepID=A0A915E8R6_9BILA
MQRTIAGIPNGIAQILLCANACVCDANGWCATISSPMTNFALYPICSAGTCAMTFYVVSTQPASPTGGPPPDLIDSKAIFVPEARPENSKFVLELRNKEYSHEFNSNGSYLTLSQCEDLMTTARAATSTFSRGGAEQKFKNERKELEAEIRANKEFNLGNGVTNNMEFLVVQEFLIGIVALLYFMRHPSQNNRNEQAVHFTSRRNEQEEERAQV